MQWLINEFKAFKAETLAKVDAAVAEHVKKQVEAAERIIKLEGELKAMKARLGKNKQQD